MQENYYARLDHINRRYQQRASFAGHAILFCGFAIYSLIFTISPAFWRQFMTLPNAGDILLILLIWTVFFAAHAARFYFQEAGYRALERELEYLGVRQDDHGKRKISRLADDGEILEVDIDSEIDEQQQNRREQPGR